MVFSSSIFLFLFLPLTLALYFISPQKARNLILLSASLLFYAWGEPKYLVVLLASIIFNYFAGLMLDRLSDSASCRAQGARQLVLFIAITGNVALLVMFKYMQFIGENLAAMANWLDWAPPPIYATELPLGISFYTFHAISYVVDVYRRTTFAQKNIFDLALYITFFPQSIAGPILRYKTIQRYLARRVILWQDFGQGCVRFISGLGKKVLIANPMGFVADQLFAIPPEQLHFGVAWLAALSYTIQIYFDFSGYSDMAIGLGRMFGFHFPENFNYPYAARSVQDFWRRWHISLSTWFRDYVYIPLGGSKETEMVTYRNLLLVFGLCGIWHGANWTFLIWGLWHGAFLVLERNRWGTWLANSPLLLQHLYALVVVVFGWVLFRADSFSQAFALFSAMLGMASASGLEAPLAMYATPRNLLALIAGVLLSSPVIVAVLAGRTRFAIARPVALAVVLAWSIVAIVSSNYNPFIYYRF